MSWEEMSRNEKPCPCGKGVVVHVVRMDDWNRVESYEEIHCITCQKEADRKRREAERIRKEKEKFKEQAIEMAKERYLNQWCEKFTGLNKKKAWEKLPKSVSGYPSLNTFYSHVKSFGGVRQYLEWRFEADIDELFPAEFSDLEIERLLRKSK